MLAHHEPSLLALVALITAMPIKLVLLCVAARFMKKGTDNDC